jgi:hypothetical protein
MEKSKLKSRNVFIDTSVIRSSNFNFSSSIFKSLLEFASKSKTYIFLTDITAKEVEGEIIKAVEEARNAHNKFCKNAIALRNINQEPYLSILTKLDDKIIINLLIEQFRSFIKSGNVNVLSTDKVSSATIFKKYFEGKPPFGSGKKRKEFPDAFALEALRQWAIDNNQTMYIVSSDIDMKNACDDNIIYYLENIKEFLDLVVTEDQIVAKIVHRLVSKNIDKFKETIESEFMNLGFWLEDQEGDILDISVDNVEIIDHSIIEIHDNRATISISSNITFSAEVEYDDMDTAIWDSEDKVAIPWNRINETVTKTINYDIEASISFTSVKKQKLIIEDLIIDNNADIGITVDDPWDYI